MRVLLFIAIIAIVVVVGYGIYDTIRRTRRRALRQREARRAIEEYEARQWAELEGETHEQAD